MKAAIEATDDENLAFVVANGIKSPVESCSDALYQQRRNLIDSAKNGVIVSLAGSDWSDCVHADGRSAALERLNRVRELFFADDFSLGSSRIPVTRQSASIKFRSYAENMRWEINGVGFATINLPANNNHYISAAGRNTEFEDRLVANRQWMNRVFSLAVRAKCRALVFFYDGTLLRRPKANEPASRDGFAEMRSQMEKLASKFPGKVLLVEAGSRQAGENPADIVWRGNIGRIGLYTDWLRLTVNTDDANPFSVKRLPLELSSGR
jgi:hypothetical protein